MWHLSHTEINVMSTTPSQESSDVNKIQESHETWMAKTWRPMMGWMYMTVCIFDFIIFPILWSIIQAIDPQGSVSSPWHPLTLEGAGLFHMAMGAVLGIAAFGRTQEKLAINNTTQNYAENARRYGGSDDRRV